MANLFKAFLFRLRRDLTFRITLFVGLGVAVVMTLIFLAIDLGVRALSDEVDYNFMFCTGENLLINSFSPGSNFGLAIPINLITFIVLEFTQGTIRNKIITGNSKTKIYFGLFLSGLVFTILLMSAYCLLCFGFGSAIGRFHPHGYVMQGTSTGYVSPDFLWKYIVLGVLAYVTIASITIFFATLFRSIGPCIPVVIMLIMICYIGGTIAGTMNLLGELNSDIKTLVKVLQFINPLHSLYASTSTTNMETGVTTLAISNEAFYCELGNNLIYTALFVTGGWLIFRKRDVK